MKSGDIHQRFKESYTKLNNSDCWIWIGNYLDSGYGRIMFNYKNYRAHRLSYILHKGEIPKDMCVCHRCDRRNCVNPNHLFLGTILENVKDRVKKGRTASGEKSGQRKLSIKKVKTIRRMRRSRQEIAKLFKVNFSTVDRIKKGITWRNI